MNILFVLVLKKNNMYVDKPMKILFHRKMNRGSKLKTNNRH